MFASAAEVLRDDSVRFADGVRAAGGEVELTLQPDMVHIWTMFPFLAEAGQTLDAIGSFVRRKLAAAES